MDRCCQFNLMFSTNLGSVSESSEIYLRPETAQGILTEFECSEIWNFFWDCTNKVE